MSQNYPLSIVSKKYLTEYHRILDRMIQGMTSAKLTNSISNNFIVQMIPHHQAAIQMSLNILKYTTCIPLEKIAQQIVSEQTKSISDMRTIQSSCSQHRNSRQELYSYQGWMDQIMERMFRAMEQAPATNQIDTDFLQEMIPHHRGAVEMSKTTLQYSICPGLKPILHAIITSQEQGIQQMEALLAKAGTWCPSTSAPSGD